MTWARREPLAAPRSERTRTGVTSTSVVRSPPRNASRAQALPPADGCDAALLESGAQPPHPGETGVVLVAGRDDLRAVDPVLQLVLDGPPHPVPVGFQIRQDHA